MIETATRSHDLPIVFTDKHCINRLTPLLVYSSSSNVCMKFPNELNDCTQQNSTKLNKTQTNVYYKRRRNIPFNGFSKH